MVETVVTGLMDEFPRLLRNRKSYLTLAVCLLAFLLGILLVTEVTTSIVITVVTKYVNILDSTTKIFNIIAVFLQMFCE